MVPFPDPEAVGVHQDASEATVQAELDVTVKAVEPAVADTFWLVGVTANVGVVPDCVTVTTTGDSPVTVTVTFAMRDVVEAFAT